MQPESESPQGKKVNLTVYPEQLLQVARGFSCFFWGIPLSLFLAVGLMNVRLLAQIKAPAYVLGILVIYWGLILLKRTKPLPPGWTHHVNQSLVIVFLLVYLSPFTEWWKQMPQVLFFTVNVVLFVLCTIRLIVLLNKLAGDVAKALYDRTFVIEAQLSGWSVLVFIVVPILGLLIYSLLAAFRHETGVAYELLHIPQRVYHWWLALALLPFTLTTAIAWKTKERCIEAVKMSSRPSITPPLPADNS